MSEVELVTELSPGAARAYEAAHKLASSIHAVPQHEELHVELEDGWDCWLKRYEYRPRTQTNGWPRITTAFQVHHHIRVFFAYCAEILSGRRPGAHVVV